MKKHLKQLRKELIFEPGTERFQVCHASNLCVLQDGGVLAAWFAGSKEGASDTGIWTAKRSGGNFCKPVLIAHDSEEAHWNPVLFSKDSGDVLLFYKVGDNIKEWSTHLRVSKDSGNSFCDAVELVPGQKGGRGPVRCKVIQLSDGSLLAGTSTENGIWSAYADRSTDGGSTWKLSWPITIDVVYDGGNTAEDSFIEVSEQSFYGRGIIQPSLWESAPGDVHMLLRSSEGKIYRSDSGDYGVTWCKAYPTGLPNNNSGIDVVRCGNGILVLCLNPVGINWGPRTPVSLWVSLDNGAAWTEEFVLEKGDGEFSYPSIVESDGIVRVSYTYNRQSIAYWEFLVEE